MKSLPILSNKIKIYNFPNLALALGIIHFLVLFSVSIAQIPASLNFKHLTNENGLSQGVVECILKDSKGFMWFTSYDGINRFDGTNCLSNDQIGPGFDGGELTRGLAEDDKGNIWMGTGTGLIKFSYSTRRFEKIVPKIVEPGIKKRKNSFFIPAAFADGWLLVYRDNAPAFLYHTLSREIRIIPNPYFGRDGKLEMAKLPANKALKNNINILLTDSVIVYFARVEEDNLGNFYWKTYPIYDLRKHPEWGNGEQIAVRDSILVISFTNGQLLKINLINREKVVLGTKPGNYPPNFYIDEQFQLWYAPESGGITVYDLKTNALKTTFIHDPENEASISNNRAITFLKTDDNTIWVAFWGKGVDYTRLTDNGFSHHLTRSDVRRLSISNFVRGIVQAKDGMFYANTQFGGIIQLDNQLNFSKRISNEYSASIYADPQGENIYFGDQKIFRYNIYNRKTTHINRKKRNLDGSLSPGSIYQFSDFDNGKILAAGIMNLVLLDPEKYEVTQLPGIKEIYNHQPIYAKQAKGGTLYITTSTEGLLVFKRKNNSYEKVFTFPDKFVTRHIWEENDTTHWIGTTNGLYVFNPVSKQVKSHFNAKNGLPNNVVYAMAPDTMGRLWVSTNKGLASLVKATGKWTSYKNFAGMQGNEYNSHTVVTASDGRIIFGGTNGLTAIRPWEVDTAYPIPKVQITAIKGDSIYDAYSKAISVMAGDNTLDFEFIGIDNIDPSACKLRYRLVGADENWVETVNPGKARYVQLAPGTYTFELMASTANGVWGSEIRSVKVEIAALWWQWKWLRILAVLALIGTAYLFASMQIKRRLYEKQMEYEKQLSIIRERERITADLHDDVGATLSSLNIYGDLAHTIWDTNPEKSREMVGKIAGQSRELMQRMSDIIWSMKTGDNGESGLTPRIRNFAQELLSGKGIEVDMDIDEPTLGAVTNPMVRKNMILIIKEALNNVAKYSGATKAGILLQKNETHLLIEIRDNGKGFDIQEVVKGNGLENMAARCRQMGGSFLLNAKPGQGTIVTCRLPLTIISYMGNE